MKVQMLREIKGSDRDKNGIAMPVKTYEKDKEYSIGEELAEVFVKIGAAKAVKSQIEKGGVVPGSSQDTVPAVVPPSEETDLSEMTARELKELAKEKQIEGYTKMNKDQLIKALS